MWRALFLATGITLCIVGTECLAIEKATLKDGNKPAPSTGMFGTASDPPQPKREIVPPQWAPWSLISTGAVVVIYSFVIPNRVKGG